MRAAGFSLIEVLIASALLVAVAVGVGEVAGRTVRANAAARDRTTATIAAAQKMEQLRSLSLSAAVDAAAGTTLRITDTTTDLSTDPASFSGPGLSASPAGTLDANQPPYVDYLDAGGAWVGRGAVPPPAAVYVRRWAVDPLPEDPDDTVVLQVVVLRVSDAASARGVARRPAGEVRLVTVRSRKAS